MHYLRLLRPPDLSVGSSRAILSLVLTITTDLREAFLCPVKPLGISITLETKDPSVANEEPRYACLGWMLFKTDV